MKPCPNCKELIASSAKACPKCGKRFGIPIFVKVLIVLVVIFGCLFGCVAACTKGVKDSVDETKNSYKDINGKTSFKINESFENKYEKITMIDVNLNVTDYNKYLGPKDGYKFIALKFNVDNIGDKDELYVSTLEFNAYADGVAVERTYLSNYTDLSATVGKGKKTVGYLLYEVPVNAKKITVEYNANFWVDGNNIEFIAQE